MKLASGFSLIELLIVLTIISILSAISFPLYSEHMVKEKRLEAAMQLNKLALALEQYYTVNNSYENATLASLGFPEKIAKDAYQLIISKAASSDFEIEAKPLNQQAEKDLTCQTLILNSFGVKNITGSGKIAECW